MRDFTLKAWQVAVAVVAIVIIFVGSLLLAPRPEDPEDPGFGGTDAQVTELLEEDHEATAWFEPLFAPAPEIESGLFAMQAALGAGIAGFAFGRLSRPQKTGAGRVAGDEDDVTA